MNGVFSVLDRPFQLDISVAAQQQLVQRSEPLCLELELYFSCLIRKRVGFLEAPHPDAQCAQVEDRLSVCFRPVMTRACSVSEVQGAPDLEAFPIQRPEAFVPRWVRIDHRHGQWTGEFGY